MSEGLSLRGGVIAVAAIVVSVFAVRLILTEEEPTVAPKPKPLSTSEKVERLRAKKRPDPKKVGAKAAAPIKPNRDVAKAAAHRERLRVLLAVAAEGQGAAPPSSQGPAANDEVSESEPMGTLDPAYVKHAIKTQFVPVVRECYETALEDGKMGGKIVLSFDILGDSEVAGVADQVGVDAENTTLEHQGLHECMVESLYAVDLPPPDGGRGKVHVNYPFIFGSG